MAGLVKRVLSRQSFDFSALPAGTTQEVILARGIDVSAFSWAAVILQIWSLSGLLVSDFVEIDLYADAPATDDPAFDVLGPKLAGMNVSGTPWSMVQLSTNGGQIGCAALAVTMKVHRDTGSPTFTIGADLVLKS